MALRTPPRASAFHSLSMLSIVVPSAAACLPHALAAGISFAEASVPGGEIAHSRAGGMVEK
jgi:hypothetical protein